MVIKRTFEPSDWGNYPHTLARESWDLKYQDVHGLPHHFMNRMPRLKPIDDMVADSLGELA